MTPTQPSRTEESGFVGQRVVQRLTAGREKVRARRGGALLWRIAVTIVGVLIVAVGIVLLPFPGPGWLVIFAGLGVLATEYTWAQRLLTSARDKVAQWTAWLGRQPRWLQGVVGLALFAFVAAVLVATYVVLYA